MNKKIIIGVLVIVGLSIGLIVTNKTQNDNNTMKLSFVTISQEIKKGALLYDVRTLDEYKLGYFEGAVNYPLQLLQQDEMPKLKKNTQIYLYCESGSRSAQAALILKEAGFSKVTDLGGLVNVKSMGGKLVTN